VEKARARLRFANVDMSHSGSLVGRAYCRVSKFFGGDR
jgi:hypothetical protein